MEKSEFDESSYLSIHKDVRLAVEKGIFCSGLEHYERHGKSEGRKIWRLDPNSHSIRDYTKLVRRLISEHPGNLPLAMAKAVGSTSLSNYQEWGNKQYHILRNFGLQDGHAIYDLACGSGRTASALKRYGWRGDYQGADIIPELVDYAKQSNEGYNFFVHHDYSIRAENNSQDIIFSWSLFTHLKIEETFLYAKDCYRALKNDGILIFSFLTFKERMHRDIFLCHVAELENGLPSAHLDAFLDQETIVILFTQLLGFKLVRFIDANDASATPSGRFGQALAIFKK